MEKFNVAEYARYAYWTGKDPLELEEQSFMPEGGVYRPVNVPEQDGWHLGLAWEAPRVFETVVVTFGGCSVVPAMSDVKLQYQRHTWPSAWRGGWSHIDDPYNGKWVTANCEVTEDGRTWSYVFDPLSVVEIDQSHDFPYLFRKSHRLRLLFKDGSDVAIERIDAFSNSVWAETKLKIEFAGDRVAWSGKLDVFNGKALKIDDSDPNSVLATIQYTDCSKQIDRFLQPIPPDQTIVTVGGGEKASFLVTDALKEPVWIRDLGVYVTTPDGPSLDEWKKQIADRPLTITERILTEPEQNWQRARAEIPELVKSRQNRYLPLGCDSNRQEICLRYSGDIFIDKRAMKPLGRDLKDLLWAGQTLTYRFPTGDPFDFRDRDGATTQSAMHDYLPIFTSEWKDREFVFTRTDFGCYLDQTPWEEDAKRGDEQVVVMSRLNIRNASEDPYTARYWMVIEPEEKLEVRDGFVYAVGKVSNDTVPIHVPAKETRWVVDEYDKPRLRAQIRTFGQGSAQPAVCSYEPNSVTSHPHAVAYDVTIPARGSHTVEFVIPFKTFTGDDGRDVIAALDYDRKLAEMVEYWDQMIADGGSITTPEPLINDYVKATIPHIAITGDKDVDSGHYLLPAGTYSYNVCANEACHQIRSLDLRGHHERALKYLQPYLDCQGSRGMHGKFKSREGVLHGLRVTEDRDYQTFNYNLDHGFVHFALCEHYFLTRDKHWANKIAGNLIAAADFVTREREYTKKTDENGEKAWEYGLIPPGHLEDNPEWLYWHAVNAYCYRGMAATAEALNDIGHPEAERIAAEAEAYRQDLHRSMRTSMDRSPATQLADGTYVPFLPTRAHLRGRDLGWIRDSLYNPIHAIECGVLEPDEDMSTWHIEDYEDNVAISRYRGRQVDTEKYWFSQGGNTIQSGLQPMVMVHLKRGRPEQAIRALYNAFAQNLYEDVRCFTEHPVAAFGLGAGPFYKTPDENCWINWLRHVMLSEKGYDELEIAPGAPRAWFADGESFEMRDVATYFGPMSYKFTSKGDEIKLEMDPPKRNAPKSIIVHFRHSRKQPIKSVTVGGKPYAKFDPAGSVTLPGVSEKTDVIASY